VVKACRQHQPDFLGLTVLQFDSERALRMIRETISPDILMIAGGPVFSADPAFAGRAGIHFVAADLAAFIDFMIRQPETAP
jgi:hypothetical protein